MSTLIEIIAAPFKKKKKNKISPKEFDFILSLDFKWMSPKEAASLRKKAIETGILKDIYGALQPTFNFNEVDIGKGVRPSELSTILKEENNNFELIINKISAECKMDKKEIIAKVNEKQNQFHELVDIEIIAILVGRELGCDLNEFYDILDDYLSE
ncbi:DUF2240 family protein [Methanosalsum natronophilum]|uniref:DUF2240 family protein n=1 Tax=Methanosalsum natronophilum TaxID=768733 RepID=A0A424YYA8_9EURY|nr:MAG: DUF2240 family protein [Methanosalsum natronophilum]